ncbi:Uncharacterised protein [Mycoplasmopsis californica]|uniref:Lipoprotein n=1 Tax=Mycoplasmopsis equigenitalium TaxID=114883 RepID=A0ABY5J204_9BACT|nr:hypothetical protein [Mycoplasmopsis equigenitalium]UUD36798.1 hypothetical protein NPA09_02775 [Mycoplasmopsis equigenitalium]VEU69904.1 Uncharacterised protein [Mycoplasmopsis californica]
MSKKVLLLSFASIALAPTFTAVSCDKYVLSDKDIDFDRLENALEMKFTLDEKYEISKKTRNLIDREDKINKNFSDLEIETKKKRLVTKMLNLLILNIDESSQKIKDFFKIVFKEKGNESRIFESYKEILSHDNYCSDFTDLVITLIRFDLDLVKLKADADVFSKEWRNVLSYVLKTYEEEKINAQIRESIFALKYRSEVLKKMPAMIREYSSFCLDWLK